MTPEQNLPIQNNRMARLKYRYRLAMHEPTTVIGILMALLFTYLILVPIISILIDAGQVQFGDNRRIGSDVGSGTLYYLTRTFLSPISRDLFWQPLINTLSVAFGAIALSFVIGTTLAWLLSRTDMFARRWFATALIVPYMLPAWTFALAWTTLFRNRTIGGQQGWFEAMGFALLGARGALLTSLFFFEPSRWAICLRFSAIRAFCASLISGSCIMPMDFRWSSTIMPSSATSDGMYTPPALK